MQLNELKYNDHLILLAKLMKCSIQNNLKLISSEEKEKSKVRYLIPIIGILFHYNYLALQCLFLILKN